MKKTILTIALLTLTTLSAFSQTENEKLETTNFITWLNGQPKSMDLEFAYDQYEKSHTINISLLDISEHLSKSNGKWIYKN